MKNKPIVGIIMGSDSDLSVMAEGAKVLEDFGVSYEICVVSAHRTPEALYDYAKTARKKGLKVIIAGAGGAAHLPGMTASMTILPVIGVPIKTKTVKGLDSLLSINQMPYGVPVATVAIDGGKNAGLLTVRILSLSDEILAEKVMRFSKKMNKEVKAKSRKLIEIGYKNYLKENH